MSPKYPNLLSPIQIGPKTYRHRIVASPIYCGTFALLEGDFKNIVGEAFEKRAKGGCAAVTVGETPTDYVYANREPFPPVDYGKPEGPAFEAFRKMARQIKDNGAVALIELSHCGESRLAGAAGEGVETVAVGPNSYVNQYGVQVLAADEALMQQVCDSFVTGAKFMRAAGYDGVMIHAGHGWLLHQFLSARVNKRTDEYGGSLENRVRFPLRVIRAVREAMGKDFLLEIRVSGDEVCEGGMGVEETAQFCQMIQDYVDLIHVSVGLYRDPLFSGEFSGMYQPKALNAGMSKYIKERVHVPVTVVGGITDPELAEQLVAEGACDLVALGRPLTCDPDYANKVIQGREDELLRCIRCFNCFGGPLEEQNDPNIRYTEEPGCALNPRTFDFANALPVIAERVPRKVLVIGGGIAGMEAAADAAELGHDVTLVEKSGELGGLIHFADTDAFKGGLKTFRLALEARLRKSGAKIRLHTAFGPEEVRNFGAEAVIIAVGSEPLVLPLPGIEYAMPAANAYYNMDKIGKRVVLVGGGLVGCEVGLHLRANGRDVTVIEMTDRLAPDAYRLHRLGMLDKMEQLGVQSFTGYKCTKIAADGVYAADKAGQERFFPADTVLAALGMKAKSAEAEALAKAAGEAQVFQIGDCTKAGKVYKATHSGYRAAMCIR